MVSAVTPRARRTWRIPAGRIGAFSSTCWRTNMTVADDMLPKARKDVAREAHGFRGEFEAVLDCVKGWCGPPGCTAPEIEGRADRGHACICLPVSFHGAAQFGWAPVRRDACRSRHHESSR